MKQISFPSIPRHYSSLEEGYYELHLFSDAADATQEAMGACIYLRKIHYDAFDASLILGMSRIFPSTQIVKFSIARKELFALTLGIDLRKQCKQSLTIPITNVYIWVDSTTEIKWCLCQTKQLTKFERNWVDKILAAANSSLPDYVQSSQNPADIASKGIRLRQKNKYQLWNQGPLFLR